MSEVRDADRDQPLPKPGRLPVQLILIRAIEERRKFGIRKYGRPLEAHNGRDALRDMWEELMDATSYFTQFVLEQGVILPGMEEVTTPGGEEDAPGTDESGGVELSTAARCPRCNHESHAAGACQNEAPSGLTNCQCGAEDMVRLYAVEATCAWCRHDPHAPGKCRSQALNLPCSCDETCSLCSHSPHSGPCRMSGGFHACGCGGVIAA